MKADEGKVKKMFEELVPKEYQCHAKVFSETESHRLPKHQSWDHIINFKPDTDVETWLDTTQGSSQRIQRRGGRWLEALTYQQDSYSEY
jgi:hypothetical protein